MGDLISSTCHLHSIFREVSLAPYDGFNKMKNDNDRQHKLIIAASHTRMIAKPIKNKDHLKAGLPQRKNVKICYVPRYIIHPSII